MGPAVIFVKICRKFSRNLSENNTRETGPWKGPFFPIVTLARSSLPRAASLGALTLSVKHVKMQTRRDNKLPRAVQKNGTWRSKKSEHHAPENRHKKNWISIFMLICIQTWLWRTFFGKSMANTFQKVWWTFSEKVAPIWLTLSSIWQALATGPWTGIKPQG